MQENDSSGEFLSGLLEGWSVLTAAERRFVQQLIHKRSRGYRSNQYIKAIRPHLVPGHPKDNLKQRLFLGFRDLEVFTGGAGGGGKTDALLLSAIQYCDEPKYSSVIIMDTYQNLKGPGAAMHRAREWFTNRFPEVRFAGSEYSFYFPTQWRSDHMSRKRSLLYEEGEELAYEWDDGTIRDLLGPPPPAMMSFGYLDHVDDKYRFKSKEYQTVLWDELTAHPHEEDYTYLFSRMRRLEWSDVPLQMKSASNPGGPGHVWVRERFVPEGYHDQTLEGKFGQVWFKQLECSECYGEGVLNNEEYDNESCFYCDGQGEQRRVFVPARAQDNPSLDIRSYRISLANMTSLERARMERGDWSIVQEGDLFRSAWFRYYQRQGEHYVLPAEEGQPKRIVDAQNQEFFLTVDTASKTKTQHDYTVIAVWCLDRRTYTLLLVDVYRDKLEVPGIFPAILMLYRKYPAQFVMIEDASSGIGVIQEARGAHGEGLTVESYSPHSADVVSRATPAIIRLGNGQVYFPSGGPHWLLEFESELVSFDGDPKKHDDQVVVLSMAADYVNTLHKREVRTELPGSARPGGLVSSGSFPIHGFPMG